MHILSVQPAPRNRWKALLKLSLGVAVCLACYLFGYWSAPIAKMVFDKVLGLTLQTVSTHNDRHTAKLYKKLNLGDINFIVTVDGKQVYRSSDYNPLINGQYRETLLWDETGTVVALELMGKRVFAYNAETMQELKKGELQQYRLFPLLSDVTYASIKDIDE